jgi:hypothetical protein
MVVKNIRLHIRAQTANLMLGPHTHHFQNRDESTPPGSADFAAGARAPQLDAVIYCTGYEYRLPFLDLAALGLTTDQQHVAPLFQHTFTAG